MTRGQEERIWPWTCVQRRVFHRCRDIAFPVKRNYSNINLTLSDIASGKVDDNTSRETQGAGPGPSR